MRLQRLFFHTLSLSIALVCALLVSLVHAPIASASTYSLNGSYWPNNLSIRYIKDSMTSKDSAGFSNALTAWNGSAAPIYFQTASSGNHVELWDENDGGNTIVGYSWENTTSNGCNANGKTVYITYYAAAYLNTYYTNGSNYTSNGAIQAAAAHELGHTVGLGHDSSTYALMYISLDVYWFQHGIKTPQSSDISGTNAIYVPCGSNS